MIKTFTLSVFALFILNTRITSQNIQLVHNCSSNAESSLKIRVNDTVWINSLSNKNATAQKTFAPGLYTIAITETAATSAAARFVSV